MKRNRLILAAVILLVVAAGAAGYWFRAEYFLWRMRAHDHAPSGYYLARVGPRVLPRLYGELKSLGSENVGEYRGDLVSVIQEIRHDVVAEEIGSPILWEVHATLLPVDESMAEAVRNAFLSEPSGEARDDMLRYISEHDFSMGVRYFCDLFDAGSDEERSRLIWLIESDLYLSLKEKDKSDTYYPWRDLSDEKIGEAREKMMEELDACALPTLRNAFEAGAGRLESEENIPLWLLSAIRMLGMAAKRDEGIAEGFWKVLPALKSRVFATLMLDEMFSDLEDEPVAIGQAAVVRLVASFEKGQGAGREAIIFWLMERHRTGENISPVYCRIFEVSSDDERNFYVFDLEDAEAKDLAACREPVMKAVEDAALNAPDEEYPPTWFYSSMKILKNLCTEDPAPCERLEDILPRAKNQPAVEAIREELKP